MTHIPQKRRRGLVYARVSSERQRTQGDSLEAQRREGELIAELEGCELAGVFSDPAVSATIPFAKRPDGARLLEAAQPGDLVIASRLDRCFRDLEDAASTLKVLKARGIGLYLKDLGGDVTADSNSELLYGVMATVAHWERRRIKDRIASVKEAQREQGRFAGGSAPFGFSVVERDRKKFLEPLAAVHDEARKLKAQGYSANAAAGHFRGMGVACSHVSVGSLWRSMGL